MTAYEMAKEYYPRLWNLKRLDALFLEGKLTQEEYTEIKTGKNIYEINQLTENKKI